ncbi:MAG: hypothetical protein JSS66_03590 [Armatimonadetes bacterium]|nr:hypothetical protein [Armatimonadota bacterium]
MTRTLALSVLVAFSVASFSQGRPGPDARREMAHPLFQKVMQGRRTLRMTGVRVLQHMEGGDRRLVTERFWQDGPKVRTEVTDGGEVGQISVESNRLRQVWDPRSNEIREMPMREAEAVMRFARLLMRAKASGRIVESEGGKVAGQRTRLLEVIAPNNNAIARLWIDPDHSAMLKFQAFDPKGAMTGSMEFTSVDFPSAIPGSTFTINKPGSRVVTAEETLQRVARGLGFKPYRLKGWKIVEARRMAPKGTKVMMSVYMDADRRVTLFQLQGSVNPERLHKLFGGQTSSYVWNTDGYQFVLVGDLPQDALRRLAGQVGV